MRSRNAHSIVVAVFAALVLAACGGDSDPGSGDAATTGAPTTTTPPQGEGSVLSTGTAHLEGSDGITVDLPLTPVTIDADLIGSIAWEDESGNLLVIGGNLGTDGPTTIEGTPSVTITITLGGEGGGFWNSQEGECTLEFDEASQVAVTGSFECEDLEGSDGPVDFTGTFEARA